MDKKWNKYFFIIIAVILATIIIVILIIMAQIKKSPQTLPVPTPSTPSPVSNTIIPPTLMPTIMMNKEGNKPVLSQNDTAAEEQILSILPDGQASGVVYESTLVKVYYDSNSDKFLAGILTEDISGAKSEAVKWFESQGMSQEGICELPLIFYLSPEVTQLLRIQGQTIKFNPIPEGCTQ